MSQKHIDELHTTADEYIQQLTLSYTNHMRWLTEHAHKSKLSLKYQSVVKSNQFTGNRLNKENRGSNSTDREKEIEKLKLDFEKKKEQEVKFEQEKNRRIEAEKQQRLEIERMRQEQERLYREDQERLRLDQEHLERVEMERQRKIEEEKAHKWEQEKLKRQEEEKSRLQMEKDLAEKARLEKERRQRLEDDRRRQEEENEKLIKAEQERLRLIREEEARAETLRQEKSARAEHEKRELERLEKEKLARMNPEEIKRLNVKNFQNQFDKFIPQTPVAHQSIYPSIENPNFKHTVTQTIKEELPDGSTKIETVKTSTQKKSHFLPPNEAKLNMDDELWKLSMHTPDRSNKIFSPKKESKKEPTPKSEIVNSSLDSVEDDEDDDSFVSTSTVGSVDESIKKPPNRILALEQAETERRRMEEMERIKKEKQRAARLLIEQRRLAMMADAKKKQEESIRKKMENLRPLNQPVNTTKPKQEVVNRIEPTNRTTPQTTPTQPVTQPIQMTQVTRPQISRALDPTPIEYVNYPLTDAEYNSHSDDEEQARRRAKKSVPKWASGERLRELTVRTKKIDPNCIFDDFCELDINDVWKYEPGLSLKPRTSSQHWDRDGLTMLEVVDYNKQMDFKKK